MSQTESDIIQNAIYEKPKNFQLAYMLAYQYAGGAEKRDVMSLFRTALEAFNAEDKASSRSGS